MPEPAFPPRGGIEFRHDLEAGPHRPRKNDLRDPVFGRPDPGVGYMGEYREDPLNPRTLQTREAYDVADPVFGSPFYMGPTSLPPVQAAQQPSQAPAPTAPRAAQAPRPLNQLEQAIEEMKRNPKMLVYGEDVADGKGGVFTATKNLTNTK